MRSLATSAPHLDVHTNRIRQIFLSYYPNRLRSIFKRTGDSNWWERNKRKPLADSAILQAVSCELSSFRGLRQGERTRFAIFDIDAGSAHHCISELGRLRTALEEVGLEQSFLYRSSRSGGWHLYIPFSDWVPSDEMARLLKKYLRASGFTLNSGQMEVFPSGNGIRLPLQAGFAWLDEQGEVVLCREELTVEQAIGLFVHDIESASNEWLYTKLRITEMLYDQAQDRKQGEASGHEERVSSEGFEHVFENKLIKENYDKGRQYWVSGLTRKHQRHEAILCVGHYLWFGDAEAGIPAYPGSWNDRARERLIRQWLEDNHNGFCNHINSGDWDTVDANIERAVHWRKDDTSARVSYPLTERSRERLVQLARRTGRLWHMDDFKKANEDRELDAREKIRDAVQELLREGRRVSGRAIAQLTGCSRNTVKKHSDLWLQSGSGVYNLGVWGVPSDSEAGKKEEERKKERLDGEPPAGDVVPEFEVSQAEPEELSLASSSLQQNSGEQGVTCPNSAPVIWLSERRKNGVGYGSNVDENLEAQGTLGTVCEIGQEATGLPEEKNGPPGYSDSS
ncbi:MAG: hypothetical protein AB7W16_20395 [Candidatus Obscuribacterales bacterium]